MKIYGQFNKILSKMINSKNALYSCYAYHLRWFNDGLLFKQDKRLMSIIGS